ncbi:hypothetical protein CRUP_003173, partial [Coryphaenoides rupestris]
LRPGSPEGRAQPDLHAPHRLVQRAGVAGDEGGGRHRDTPRRHRPPPRAQRRRLQVPSGGDGRGPRRYARCPGGHGPRGGPHRPQPALGHTPLPGAVAQPAQQTRRDPGAPDRAIAPPRSL